MKRTKGVTIYGEKRNTQGQNDAFDKEIVDAIAKPLINYNRRLISIMNQMINTQGPDFKQEVILQRLNILKQEIHAIALDTPGSQKT